MRPQLPLPDLPRERRVTPVITQQDNLIEQGCRPQVVIVAEPGPDVTLERRQRIRRRRPAAAGRPLARQIRPDSLTVSSQMAGYGRDRPAPVLQRMSFHVFSSCEHVGEGLFELAGQEPPASRRPRLNWGTFGPPRLTSGEFQ